MVGSFFKLMTSLGFSNYIGIIFVILLLFSSLKKIFCAFVIIQNNKIDSTNAAIHFHTKKLGFFFFAWQFNRLLSQISRKQLEHFYIFGQFGSIFLTEKHYY